MKSKNKNQHQKNKRHRAMLSYVVKRKHNYVVKQFFTNHYRAFLASLDRIFYNPFSSLLTIAVIAISLSLPISLEILLKNIKYLSKDWDKGTQISLYLKKNISNQDTKDLILRLKENTTISNIRYISESDGLKLLQKNIGIENFLNQLKENPLPKVIVITPYLNAPSISIDPLLATIKAEKEVAMVRVDKAWVERLYNIIDFLRQTIYALIALLGSGVIIIVGNTVRLAVQDSHEETSMLKLLGATKSFVRRPFLHTGFLYGFCGSLLAHVIVTLILVWLKTPIEKLTISYGSEFIIQHLNLSEISILCGAGALLGTFGAFLAANF